MPLTINGNAGALRAQAEMVRGNKTQSGCIKRLASGNALDTASRDIIALTIGGSLKADKISLESVLRNSQQMHSMLSVSDNAMSKITDITTNLKELSITAAGEIEQNQRSALELEFSSLLNELDRIADETSFNGVHLLNGSHSGPVVGLKADKDGNLTKANGGDSSVASLTLLGKSTDKSLSLQIDARGGNAEIDSGKSYQFTAPAFGTTEAAVAAKGAIADDAVNTVITDLRTSLEPIFGNNRINISSKAGADADQNTVTLEIDGSLNFDVAVVAKDANKYFSLTTNNFLNSGSKVTLAKDNTNDQAYNGNIKFVEQVQADAKKLGISLVTMMSGSSSSDQVAIKLSNTHTNNLFRKPNTAYNPDMAKPSISSSRDARDAIDKISTSIDNILLQHSEIGVAQKKVETIQSVIESNITAEEEMRSIYQDTDYILEPGKLAQSSMKFNASMQALAQNQQQTSAAIMSLLRSATNT